MNETSRRRLVAIAAASTMSAGCATPRYACPIPEGEGGCRSVAQVYHDTLPGTDTATPGASDPARDRGPSGERDAITRMFVSASAAPSLEVPGPGAALLSTPRVLRVLVTPWQDADGDLQAGGFLYLRLDEGQWTISP